MDYYRKFALGTACNEENELLHTNSIKMTEVGFGRSDSEDDIIEDYDDDIAFKTPCLRNRTPLERGLIVLVVVAVIVIIALAVGLTRPKIIPRQEYCQSAACVQATGAILEGLDTSVSPCHNFFRYACGGWVAQNPIPPGYHKWDRFQELSAKNLYVLKGLIESQAAQSEAERKMQRFYNSCLSDGGASKSRVMEGLRRLVGGLGGWSLDRRPLNDSWQLQVTLENVHRLGAWPLFHLDVDVDERHPTQRHILKLDLGETVLPAEMFPEPSTPASPTLSTTPPSPTSSPSTVQGADSSASSSSSNSTGTSTSTSTTTTTTTTIPPTTTTPPRPAKNMSEVLSVFLDETRELLMAFGANESEARQMAADMMELEKRIASASPRAEHLHSRMQLYNVMTVYDLERNYSLEHMSWSQYLVFLGFSATEDTQVVVLHPEYLVSIATVVKDYMSTPKTKSILRDYLMVSVIRYFRQYFDPKIFQVEETEDDDMIEAWKRCTFYTNRALPFATGAAYVHGARHQTTIEKVESLITHVKNAFKDYLLRKFWMDANTRKKAADKIDNIIDKISYPSFILNTTFLDSHYKDLAVAEGNWLQTIRNWRQFELSRMNRQLGEKPDRKTSWLRPPVTVNAFYSPTRNDIIFPIAMFHLPFYVPDGPTSYNFGAMGSIIGHEITHAFDPQGRQYDPIGRLENWWDPDTASKFYITTECMKNQYNRMRVMDYQLNGEFTLDENIADNGGLRAAMYAYKMYVDEHGEELPLPGLNMTHYQIFFTSFAQMYCSKWTELGLLNHLLKDPHSPGVARVNGVLANSRTFSWAFECSNMAPMNSQIKCEVW